MNTIIIFADVINGKFCGFNRRKLIEELKYFEGKRIECKIQKKSKRSIQQNRWYWMCVDIISKHLGYSKDEMHEIIKFKFLKREKINEQTGEIFEYIKSTTLLNKDEFCEFMDNLIEWSGGIFGISLPMPEIYNK